MSNNVHDDLPSYMVCGCQCGCPPKNLSHPRQIQSPKAEPEPIRSIKLLDEPKQTFRPLYEEILTYVAQQQNLSSKIIYLSEAKKTSPYYVNMPAFVINEQVLLQGNKWTLEDVKILLQKHGYTIHS